MNVDAAGAVRRSFVCMKAFSASGTPRNCSFTTRPSFKILFRRFASAQPADTRLRIADLAVWQRSQIAGTAIHRASLLDRRKDGSRRPVW